MKEVIKEVKKVEEKGEVLIGVVFVVNDEIIVCVYNLREME